MVIGLAFSSAYKEFLKSHGVNEESLEQFEYQHVLSSQTKSDSELDSLKDQNKTKEVCFPPTHLSMIIVYTPGASV